MKSNQNRRSTKPLFVFLLGTLAFSLSAIPGHSADSAVSGFTSLSSEFGSGCTQMVSDIDDGQDTGTCELKASKDEDDLGLIARIKVTKGDVKTRGEDDQVVTSTGWIYTAEILCGKSKKCSDDVLPSSPIRGKLKSFRDIGEALAAGKKGLAEAQNKLQDEKDKQAELDECKVDADGKEIKTDRARVRCEVKRMKGMGTEEAAEYYEDKIQPHLTELVGSDKLGDQREGMALLEQLTKNRAGGKLVKESITDLFRFGNMKASAESMQSQILNKQADILAMPNGPARTQAMAQLAQMKTQMQGMQSTADAYLQQRSDTEGNMKFPASVSYDYGAALTLNMEDYQARLDQMYNTITQNQALLINQNVANQVANGVIGSDQNAASRAASRGGTTVTTTPGSTAPAVPVNRTGVRQGAMNTAIPQVGSGVNIR